MRACLPGGPARAPPPVHEACHRRRKPRGEMTKSLPPPGEIRRRIEETYRASLAYLDEHLDTR